MTILKVSDVLNQSELSVSKNEIKFSKKPFKNFCRTCLGGCKVSLEQEEEIPEITFLSSYLEDMLYCCSFVIKCYNQNPAISLSPLQICCKGSIC